MVVTKHRQRKGSSGRKSLISYILNDYKTNELGLVSDYGFDNYLDFPTVAEATEMYSEQMQLNDERYYTDQGKIRKDRDITAHHLIQSFSPEDNLTPKEINKIGYELAKRITKGEHKFIVATHIDKGHIHNHIVINNVRTDGQQKLSWNKKFHRDMVRESDYLADLYGAKVIESKKFTYQEYMTYKSSNYAYQLRQRINYLLQHSSSYEDFLKKAELMQIKIDLKGKHMTFLMTDTEQKRVIRGNKVDKLNPISEESLKRHFAKEELNKRLKYLFEHSKDIEDFRQRAYALNVRIKNKGEHLSYTFSMLNSEHQLEQFYFEDKELNKNAPFDRQFLEKQFEGRETFQRAPDIKSVQEQYQSLHDTSQTEDLTFFYDQFKATQREKQTAADFELILQGWQIEKESDKGLYVKVWFGVERQGLLFLPNKNLTIERMGAENKKQYTIHLNEKDFYYIHSQKDGDDLDRYMTGQTLIRQLSGSSQEIPQRKYVTTEDIREKIIQISYLNRIKTNREDLIEFRNQFVTDFANQEEKLKKLQYRHQELLQVREVLTGLQSDDKDTQRAVKHEFTRLNLPRGLSLAKTGEELKKLEKLMGEEVNRLKGYSERLNKFVGIINQGERAPSRTQESYRKQQKSREIEL